MDDEKIRQFAHDLANTTLMVVGFMDTIPPALASSLPHYAAARKSVSRMITLINDVQREVHGRDTDLIEGTAPELWEMIRVAARDHSIPVRVDTDGCPHLCNQEQTRFLVEPKRIDRIVMNIVQNAHTAGATWVRVHPICRGDGLCDLAFLDNGKGMSAAELRRIGVPYTAEDGMVHGEGCRVIRALCAEMGAVAYWESIEGLGTRVTIQWTAAGTTPRP